MKKLFISKRISHGIVCGSDCVTETGGVCGGDCWKA